MRGTRVHFSHVDVMYFEQDEQSEAVSARSLKSRFLFLLETRARDDDVSEDKLSIFNNPACRVTTGLNLTMIIIFPFPSRERLH